MRRLSIIPFLMFLGCSPTTQDIAVTTANEVHQVAETENKIILDYCVPKYKAANTKDEVAKVDKMCVPARTAYLSTKTAWEALVAVLQSYKNGKAQEADIIQAANKLGEVYADLKEIAKGLQP